MLGLPLHPVVVHFAVVLLTLVPLAALVSLVWPALRVRLGWLLPVGAVAAGVAGLVAGSSGEDLFESVQVAPQVVRHADLGHLTEKVGVMLALLVVWWWVATSPEVAGWADRRAAWLRSTGMKVGSTVLMALGAIGALVLVTLTGHAGGVAVWGGR